MKKIVSILMLCTLGLVYTSCTNEVEDLFDKSASERYTEAARQSNEILQSAPNGWLMYYYGSVSYGGYNLWLKFNRDNTVTAATERIKNGGVYTQATSHYKMEQSAGVILSFDEYNNVLHYFSDPVNPDNIGTNGAGFGGDLEFRIKSATPERIVLSGKKTNATIVMVPMPAGTDVDTYLNQIQAIEKDMIAANLALVIDGKDTIQAVPNSPYRMISFTVVDEKGVPQTVRAPYIVTPEGYQLYRPITIKDRKIEKFVYSPNAQQYQEASDANVVLHCLAEDLNKQLVKSVWFLDGEGMSAANAAIWKEYSYECKEEVDQTTAIQYAYFGTYSRSNTFGLSIFNGYLHHYIIEYKLIGKEQIEFTRVSEKEGFNGAYYLRYCGEWLAPCIRMFTKLKYDATSGKPLALSAEDLDDDKLGKSQTYTLETDNLKNPSYIKMTNADGEEFTLSLQSKNYPFGQE